MSLDKLDALINNLSDELEEVKPLCHPLTRMFPLLLVSFTYVLAVIALLGLRDDWMLKMFHDIQFLFEFVLALSVSVSAGLALGWLSIPDMRGQKWVLAVPFTLTAVFMFWALLRMLFEVDDHFHFQLNHCTLDGIFMLILPIGVLTFFSRRGATTHPHLSALMTVLSFSGLAWAGLRLTCGADSFSHAFLMHFVPFIAIGVLFGIFARKIFRW